MITVGTIPPCTIFTVDLSEVGSFLVREGEGDSEVDEITDATWDHLELADVHVDWRVNLGEPPTTLSPEDKQVGIEGDYWLDEGVVAEQASDCGTG